LLALALLLAGCHPKTPEAVRSGPPQRIVSMAPNVTELLFALGAGDRVVGVTRYCDRPPEVLKLPKIGGFADPDLEAILALRPDLVVAPANPVSEPVLRRLGEVGVATLAVKADDLAGIDATVRAVGVAVGRGEEGERLVAKLHADLGAAITGATDRRPRVLFVYDRRPIVAAGPGTFADELVRRAGGVNVAADARVAYPKYDIEDVLRLAPDVVLDASMAGEDESAIRAFWSRWAELPAVKAGRVFRADQPGLLQPGLHVAEGLAWLVGTLRQ
jgi:iron complex transport system substrate-binding protein